MTEVSVLPRVHQFRAQELRESEFRSCVKVEVAVLDFPPLMSLTVSVDVKQY